MNIMERLISDIFPPFVFNNIMEDTFIFPPPRFFAPRQQPQTNCFCFNDIVSAQFCPFAINTFCLLVHNGKAR